MDIAVCFHNKCAEVRVNLKTNLVMSGCDSNRCYTRSEECDRFPEDFSDDQDGIPKPNRMDSPLQMGFGFGVISTYVRKYLCHISCFFS